MDMTKFKYIGNVIKAEPEPSVFIKDLDGTTTVINDELFNKNSYNHFGG